MTREDMRFALQVEILSFEAHLRAYRRRYGRAQAARQGPYGGPHRALFAAEWLVLAHTSLRAAEGVARRIGALLTMLLADGVMQGPSAEAVAELLDTERKGAG